MSDTRRCFVISPFDHPLDCLFNATARDAKEVAGGDCAEETFRRRDGGLGLLPRAQKQAHERVIGGRLVANAEKMLSLYEADVRVIVRGKAGAEVEFANTEKHFTAWLGLVTGSRQRGERRGRQKRGRDRAGRWHCVMARSAGRSVDKALGGFYRSLQARRGGLVANLALARTPAALRLNCHG